MGLEPAIDRLTPVAPAVQPANIKTVEDRHHRHTSDCFDVSLASRWVFACRQMQSARPSASFVTVQLRTTISPGLGGPIFAGAGFAIAGGGGGGTGRGFVHPTQNTRTRTIARDLTDPGPPSAPNRKSDTRTTQARYGGRGSESKYADVATPASRQHTISARSLRAFDPLRARKFARANPLRSRHRCVRDLHSIQLSARIRRRAPGRDTRCCVSKTSVFGTAKHSKTAPLFSTPVKEYFYTVFGTLGFSLQTDGAFQNPLFCRPHRFVGLIVASLVPK